MLWSFTPLEPQEETGQAALEIAVVKVVGRESAEVKEWMVEQLKSVEEIVGAHLFRNAF